MAGALHQRSTALHIAENRDRYSLLSRLPLWYARYKPAIGLHFPKGHWQTYTLWQFSARRELRRALLPLPRAGTPLDIDVNVASMSAEELRAEWPFGDLVDKTAGPMAVAESVPLPIPRRIALEGGDVTLEYAEVVEGDEQPTLALAVAAAAKCAAKRWKWDMPRPSPPPSKRRRSRPSTRWRRQRTERRCRCRSRARPRSRAAT